MTIPRALFEQRLLLEAAAWNRAPFAFKGYTRRGADCVGLIVGMLRKCGVWLPDDDGDVYEPDWFLHDRGRNRYLEGWLKFGRIVRGLDADAQEIPDQGVRAGDVICFWSPMYRKVTHSGLYLGGNQLIHAHRRDRGVKILALEVPWAHRSPKTWIRLQELERVVDGG